jgi:hypothetical protein
VDTVNISDSAMARADGARQAVAFGIQHDLDLACGPRDHPRSEPDGVESERWGPMRWACETSRATGDPPRIGDHPTVGVWDTD